MRSSLAIAAAALALTGWAAAAESISKSYDLAGFDRIDVSGVYSIEVTVGGDFAVSLSGSPEEMDRAEVGVDNGVLSLGQTQWKRGEKGRRNDRGLEAKITMPSLNALEVSGVVEGEVVGIDADRFDLDLSGVGDVRLTGVCGRLDADVSGVGDLDAEELKCKTVAVDVSGVGSAVVFASEEVDAEVSGMGDIDVYGSPAKVTKSKNMFADVTIH